MITSVRVSSGRSKGNILRKIKEIGICLDNYKIVKDQEKFIIPLPVNNDNDSQLQLMKEYVMNNEDMEIIQYDESYLIKDKRKKTKNKSSKR